MPLTIEAVTVDDIEAIGALARVVWQAAYAEIIDPAQIDYMLAQRYDPQRLRDELATPGIHWDRACVDGRLAGFASTLRTAVPGELKLDKLYVDPARQRRGIGGALIERALRHARDAACETLILAVNKRNAPAIAAYRKHGFVVREAVCVDIGNGFVMDDFIMARSV
jgi:ribosomal protein S18 acetylase RimI-like enzyme